MMATMSAVITPTDKEPRNENRKDPVPNIKDPKENGIEWNLKRVLMK